MNIEWLLRGDEPSVAAKKLHRHFGEQLDVLEQALHGAARGSRTAAREYLVGWQRLATSVLELVHQERPDLVVASRTGELLIVDAQGSAIDVTPDLLLAVAPTAPFSPWVAVHGLSQGLGLRLLAEVREAVPGSDPLVPTPGRRRRWTDVRAMRTALHLVESALAERAGSCASTPLERVQELFGFDRTELARLFGVKRQAIEQWAKRGVPAERQAKLAAVLAIGELLTQKLRPGALPGVARTPAEAYGGRTMLEMIAADEHEALLGSVRASFDWASAA
jgi:DNA-binding transcriptional regulator YdaS (Cro superfamily)